ncbi:Uncharacterised protein [BD1-7 clade bacterium]|nr:Uncharacterised protein [BD1-7 clade bacterium]
MKLKTLATAITASTLLFACSDDDDNNAEKKIIEPASMTLIGRFNADQELDEGLSEIVTYHKTSQSILVINAKDSVIDVLDASTLTSEALANPLSGSNLTRRSTLDVSENVAASGGINSVAVHGNLMAVAVENDDKQANGFIAFYTLNDQGSPTFQKTVNAGALPDNVVFTHDGAYALSANEGEPSGDYTNDPEGSVTIVPIANGLAGTPQQVSLNVFNAGQPKAEQGAAARVTHPEASVAQDLEPEYIAISADNKKAYVSLQENNAIAVIDIENATAERLFSLGEKDHGIEGNGLDASNKDDAINIQTYDNVFGLYMPDTIAAYRVNGTNYIVTANEGDSREYAYSATEAECDAAGHDFDDGDCFSWVDEKSAGKLDLDETVFPDADALQENEKLGKIKAVVTEGDVDNDEKYEKVVVFGARSFSIFNADNGTRVFDSGDDFEQITKTRLGEKGFNATNDENGFDDRSDNKGPEPEALALGTVNGITYAFVGLERTGGIMMYDISNPAQSEFLEYTVNRDFETDIETNFAAAGDLAPEGMKFVDATDSPTGNALLIVGNEVSGTTTVYEVK